LSKDEIMTTGSDKLTRPRPGKIAEKPNRSCTEIIPQRLAS